MPIFQFLSKIIINALTFAFSGWFTNLTGRTWQNMNEREERDLHTIRRRFAVLIDLFETKSEDH